MGLAPLENKLKRELTSEGEMTEARAVYILVCVRKLLELKPAKLPSLKFHCDWALHSRLSRTGAINVVKLFDDLEYALQVDDQTKSAHLKRKLQRIVNQEHFRRELGNFLKTHNLPTEVSTVTAKWLCFWNVYMTVIEDVPLEFTAIPIREIRKVTVTRMNEPRLPPALSQDFAFGVKWILERFDGTKPKEHGLDYEVFHPLPDANPAGETERQQ